MNGIIKIAAALLVVQIGLVLALQFAKTWHTANTHCASARLCPRISDEDDHYGPEKEQLLLEKRG